MSYNLSCINQYAIVTNGLNKGTDINDWVLLGYMNDLSIKSKENGVVRINFSFLIKELPLLRINCKSAISKRLSKLCSLGLIEKVFLSDKDAYEKLNNDHLHGCQFCGDESGCYEQHHYPVRSKNGGSKTIFLCVKCHREFHSITDHGGYIIKCGVAFVKNEKEGFE